MYSNLARFCCHKNKQLGYTYFDCFTYVVMLLIRHLGSNVGQIFF